MALLIDCDIKDPAAFRRWRAYLKSLADSGNVMAWPTIPLPNWPEKWREEGYGWELLIGEYRAKYEMLMLTNGIHIPTTLCEFDQHRYFGLYPEQYCTLHCVEMIKYKNFIKCCYFRIFKEREIALKLIYNPPLWDNTIRYTPMTHWRTQDWSHFNSQVIEWDDFLKKVDQTGRTPAIILLGIRTRRTSQHMLSAQPLDVIKIIAKYCVDAAWVEVIKGSS